MNGPVSSLLANKIAVTGAAVLCAVVLRQQQSIMTSFASLCLLHMTHSRPVWTCIDGEALGQVPRDLALAYNGEPIPAREETRLIMQHIISRAAGLQSSTAMPSGHDLYTIFNTCISSLNDPLDDSLNDIKPSSCVSFIFLHVQQHTL